MIDIQRDILPLKNAMYRLALRLAPSSQEAEDVVQDVIIKLWKMSSDSCEGGRLDAIQNLEALALRMVRNLAIDRQRMRINNTEDLSAINDAQSLTASSDYSLEQRERLASIQDIMQQLPEKQRSAMHLRDFEGYSYKEVAEMLHMTEDQVKINIYRARQFVKSKVMRLSE